MNIVMVMDKNYTGLRQFAFVAKFYGVTRVEAIEVGCDVHHPRFAHFFYGHDGYLIGSTASGQDWEMVKR